MITESDVSVFSRHNVIDTSSIWNLLSSSTLYTAAQLVGCTYCCTQAVHYEAAIKKRSHPRPEAERLKQRFLRESESGRFPQYRISIEDLQDLESITETKRLGMGELSSIAFAHKINHALLTDDKRAAKAAKRVIPANRVQSVPHLFGWLFFTAQLSDSDKTTVIAEHGANGQGLAIHFEGAYNMALRSRLMAGANDSGGMQGSLEN